MHSSINPKEQLRNVEIGGIILTEFLQPPSMTVPRHFHECATVLFTIRGFGSDCIAGRVQECHPSSLLIRPAEESHTHHYGQKGIHGLVIEIRPERAAEIRSFSTILDCVGNFKEPLLSELGMRLYAETRIMDSASALAIEGLVLELLAWAARRNSERTTSPTQPLWLRRAREYIQQSFTEPLRLSQVAKMVGVHPAHLAEVFRRHFGCTVGQYIRQLRLDYAARQVMLSDKSLAEISATAGFYDQSHFTKLFKRRIGRSPAEMRALARIPKSHTKSLLLSKPL
jgi:AraC family transcriptional regulator